MGLRKSRQFSVDDGVAGGSRSRERGLATIEFIFVLPLLLALLVGVIDFGFLFNDVISVRQGARDGGRQAAVGKFGVDSSCYLDSGFNVTGNQARLFCLTKDRDGISDRDTRVRVVVGDLGQPGVYQMGRPVTICEQYRMRSVTGVLNPIFKDKVFSTRTTFRVEVTNKAGGLSDAWENSLPNSDWSFCTYPSALS